MKKILSLIILIASTSIYANPDADFLDSLIAKFGNGTYQCIAKDGVIYGLDTSVRDDLYNARGMDLTLFQAGNEESGIVLNPYYSTIDRSTLKKYRSGETAMKAFLSSLSLSKSVFFHYGLGRHEKMKIYKNSDSNEYFISAERVDTKLLIPTKLIQIECMVRF